ncbi:MAG: ABC transporter ATP-binding protein [Lachnospiraceae bacterium]|nr:ABC transporter ATP-binding protein [Lachnospiraceae bacterium]
MINEKLPGQALEQLAEKGIAKEDIIAVSPVDLSFDSEFLDGYVVLTLDKLAVINFDDKLEQVRIFKGVTGTHYGEDVKDHPMQLSVYDREKLGSLKLEHNVATNVLLAVNGETSIRLACCTNLYLSQMNLLVKASEDPASVKVTVKKEEEAEEELCCPICHTPYPDPKRKICPKCMNKRSVFFRTLKYFLNYKAMILLLILGYIVTALLNLVWPYFSGTVLYDRILDKDNEFLAMFGFEDRFVTALLVLVLMMFGTRVLQALTNVVHGVATARIVTSAVRDMKKDVFSAMGTLSMRFYTSKQTGNLMTRVLRDAERVSGFFLDGFPSIFINSITIVATFIVMFSMNWQMSLVAVILMPLLVVMSVKLKPGLWVLHGRRHRAESSVNNRVNDNLTGARVVRAFGQQDEEINRFEPPNDYLRDAEVRIVKYNNRFTLLYEMVQTVSSIWVWVLGVFLVMHFKTIRVGELLTFVGYIAQLNAPMRFFSWIFRSWTDSINAAQRMFEIMDAKPDVVEAEHPIRLENPKGEITIENMSFGYDSNRPVLKKINLHVQPGEMLGIVGRSGAGKTTLVNLLSRLYDVDEGVIKIDGIDVRELSFNDLRRNVAMVSQDTYIFMGSVADTIAYARDDVTREEIIQAAKLAGAHDFICRMPDGYDTMVGATGRQLSGGERQRLSIARAIVANPKILILDEATASVDTETEKLIQASLEKLVQGRTTLSIAHRLSTLRDAGHLIVIENGRIEEEGSREELEAIGGIYHRLMELQTKSLSLEEI